MRPDINQALILNAYYCVPHNLKAVHLRGHRDKTDSNILECDADFKEVLNYIQSNDYYYGVIEQNTANELEEISKSIEVINSNGMSHYL